MKMRNVLLSSVALVLALPVQADTFKLVNRDGRYAEYEGTMVMTGRFERRQDAETLDWRGDRVCFFPEAADVKKLPRVFDSRPPMFCFSNSRSAVTQLQLPAQPPAGSCGIGGRATVNISRYIVENGVGETYDMAMLNQVSDVTPLTAVPCK
ncbi:MAG: hypothetical protein Q8J78_16195 [Moraxellaceae bacterium]|nr:hypothetical protein [Moraxellaceae bacterium]